MKKVIELNNLDSFEVCFSEDDKNIAYKIVLDNDDHHEAEPGNRLYLSFPDKNTYAIAEIDKIDIVNRQTVLYVSMLYLGTSTDTVNKEGQCVHKNI